MVSQDPIEPVVVHASIPTSSQPRRSARLATQMESHNLTLCQDYEQNMSLNDMSIVLVTISEANLDLFTPKSAHEAISSKNSAKWLAAMQREKECHTKNKTFGDNEGSTGEKAIPADWVFRIKHRGGPIELDSLEDKQFKARVVIRGQFMKQGINFNDTFAPVAKPTTLRAILAMATKYRCLIYSGDIETAFLTADMDCTVFVKMPPFWGNEEEAISATNTTHSVKRLLKGVPGIPQGSRLFFLTFSEHLISIGYIPSAADRCLFINKALGERNAVVLWVDDFLYVCESEKAKNEFIKQIRLKFTVNIFAETRSFLGIEVNRDIDKRQLQLNQRNTTRVLLERSNMLNCNAAKTPSPSGAIFSVADCPNDPATNKTTTEYRSLIALLNFISCWTRPDITFTVNKLCKFMSNPGESHWKQLKYLIRYMAGTQDWGLLYDMSVHEGPILRAFSDSSFGDCPDTGRSTLAHIFTYHGAIMSWYSKLNGFVTTCTNHSEYAALSLAAREAEWMITLFNDIEPLVVTTPLPIHVDNSGVVSLVFNPVAHQSNKHVKLSCHYARELTAAKLILPCKVSSQENLADLFTKPLPLAPFKKLASQIVHASNSTVVIQMLHIHRARSDNPDSDDTDSDSNANRYYKSISRYEAELYHEARTKQTSRRKSLPLQETSESIAQIEQEAPQAQPNEQKDQPQGAELQHQISEEEEAKLIEEENSRSSASYYLGKLPAAQASASITLQPQTPLLFCLNCGIYNSTSYTQLMCSSCKGNKFSWQCACVISPTLL